MIATVIIFFMTLKLGYRIANNGKIQKLTIDGGASLLLYTISIALLYWAGLFNNFN